MQVLLNFVNEPLFVFIDVAGKAAHAARCLTDCLIVVATDRGGDIQLQQTDDPLLLQIGYRLAFRRYDSQAGADALPAGRTALPNDG